MEWAKFWELWDRENGIKNFESMKPYHFKIFWFLLKNDKKPKFRPWVVSKINKNNSIIISCTTRQDELMKYKFKEKNADCVIQIADDKIPNIFNKTTFIDCNLYDDKNYKSLKELKENIDWKDFKVVQEKIPRWLIDKLAESIVNSPSTRPQVKNGFRSYYSNLFPRIQESFGIRNS